MSTWKPATGAEVEAIVLDHLRGCTDAQRRLFERIRTPLASVSIKRLGRAEALYAVARVGDALIIWDDVEEGFELATPDQDGVLREYGASQFELSHVLHQLRDYRG